MKKRIGIIGFGWIARDVHYPNYLTIADECEITALAVEQYLSGIKDFGADVLILGCTHFPIIANHIGAYLGDAVTLINSGSAAAKELAREAMATGGCGKCDIYVSDNPATFEAVAKIFLGTDTVPEVHTVRIGE